MMRFIVCSVVAAVMWAVPGASPAAVMSNTDLWDISQGSVVDDTSGVLNYRASWRSDKRDMFGGAFATIEASNTLFKDYMAPGGAGGPVPAGYTHYVEWHTPDSVTLRRFALHASNEGMNRRAFSQFSLYSSSSAGGPWSTIYDTGPGYTYTGMEIIETDITAVDAQYFRAEFVQAPWINQTAVGPRIHELDGFDTFLDGSTGAVPEPTTFVVWSLLGLIGIGWWRRKPNVGS